MAKCNFQCPQCGKIKEVDFIPGNPVGVFCSDCNKEMKRVFKDLLDTEVQSDEMLKIGQMMNWADTPSGEHRAL
jgi:hypothetical protein